MASSSPSSWCCRKESGSSCSCANTLFKKAPALAVSCGPDPTLAVESDHLHGTSLYREPLDRLAHRGEPFPHPLAADQRHLADAASWEVGEFRHDGGADLRLVIRDPEAPFPGDQGA